MSTTLAQNQQFQSSISFVQYYSRFKMATQILIQRQSGWRHNSRRNSGCDAHTPGNGFLNVVNC
jgi:hypothetical protein